MTSRDRSRTHWPRLTILGTAGLALVSVLLLTSFEGTSAAADGAVSMEVSDLGRGPITVANTNSWFLYTINYSCPSFEDDCEGMVVVDDLPDELEISTIVGGAHPTTEIVDQDTKTVTFNFDNDVPAGASGQLSIKVRFAPYGDVADGLPVVNQADVSTTNGVPSSSNQVTVTSVASSDWYTNIWRPGSVTPTIDQGARYGVQACSTSKTARLDLIDAELVLHYPADADVLDTHGGFHNNGQKTITWTYSRREVDTCISRYPVLRYPSSDYQIGNNVTLDLDLNGEPVGESYGLIDTDSENHNLIGDAPGLNTWKWSNVNDYEPGDFIYWYPAIETINKSNTSLQNVVWHDDLPPEFRLESIRGGKWKPATTAAIQVSYNDGTDWTTAKTLNGTSWEYWYAPALPAPHVTDVRWVFTEDVPSYFDLTGWPYLRGYASKPDVNTNDYAVPNLVTNCVLYSADNVENVNKCDNITIDVIPPQRVAKPLSDTVTPDPHEPGQTLSYMVEIRNDATSDLDIVNPRAASLVPTFTTYVGWSDLGGEGPPPDTVTIDPDWQGFGLTLVTWEWNSWTMVPGSSHRIQVDSTVEPGHSNGTQSISTYMLSDGSQLDCESSFPDSFDFDNDADITEQVCYDNGEWDYEHLLTAGMTVEKWILGDPDPIEFPHQSDPPSDPPPTGCPVDADNYTKFPCVAQTDSLGNADYKLIATNTDEVELDNVIIVDVLPYFGDVGVTDSLVTTARGSEWEPTLDADPTVISEPGNATVTTYVSVSENPCRPDMALSPGGSDWPTGCVDDWVAVGSIAAEDVKSIKWEIDFSGAGFAPSDSVTLGVQLVAGSGSPTGGEIAWNSFGYRADRVDTGQRLLPSEPIKVGIVVVEPDNGFGGYAWLDADKDGIQDGGEPAWEGIQVDVWQKRGEGLGIGFDEVIATVYTTPDGDWFIGNLDPGKYYAEFFKPTGTDFSPRDQGADDTVDSDFDADEATGKTVEVSIGHTTYVLDTDAGFTVPGGPVECVHTVPEIDYSGPREVRQLPPAYPCPI